MLTNSDSSVLIIGGGIAGLSTALRLADEGHRVLVLSKNPLADTASFQAQGGIAAVMDSEDSLSSHLSDTIVAGASPVCLDQRGGQRRGRQVAASRRQPFHAAIRRQGRLGATGHRLSCDRERTD